jgi:hypothetical protein
MVRHEVVRHILTLSPGRIDHPPIVNVRSMARPVRSALPQCPVPMLVLTHGSAMPHRNRLGRTRSGRTPACHLSPCSGQYAARAAVRAEVKAAPGELRPELFPAPQTNEVVAMVLQEREIRPVLEMLWWVGALRARPRPS